MTLDSKEVIVAADIGGTQMRVALVRGDGNILLRREIPTPHSVSTSNELIDLISSVVQHRRAGERGASRVVVGLPGPVDYACGQLLSAPHLPESWPDQLSEGHLSKAIGLSVQIANDADMAAVGETYFGAGRGYCDVAYVTISTGIGAGFVSGGQLLRGQRSFGEIGHTIIDWTAWLAHGPATLEELSSGSGMTRMAVEHGLGARSGKEIHVLAQQGNADALQIWTQAVSAAATGIINLSMTFSPEIIVIGGGLGLQPDFFTALAHALAHGAPLQMPLAPLAQATLGDNAGLIGAARWAEATTESDR